MAYGPPPVSSLPKPTIQQTMSGGSKTAGSAPSATSATSTVGAAGAYGQPTTSVLEAAQSILAVALAANNTLSNIEMILLDRMPQRQNESKEKEERDNSKKRDPFAFINKVLAGTSAVGAALAGNNLSGTIGAASALGAATIPGPVGAVIGVFGTLVSASKALVNAFLDRAKELKQYSPTIAAAEAVSQVRKMMADIREANVLGNDYARLIQSQTDIELQIRDLLIPMKQFLLENLASILEGLTRVLSSPEADKIGKGASFLGNAIMTGWNALTFDFEGVKMRMKKMDANLDAIKNNTKPKAAEDIDLTKQLLLDRLVPLMDPHDMMNPVHPAEQLVIPLIGGM